LAAGFAEEHCTEYGLEDYWTEEAFDMDAGSHIRPAMIIGPGDGGLIDAIRCCAREPKLAWLIPLGVIGHLRDDSATVLPDTSLNKSDAPRLARFSRIEQLIQSHEESIRTVAWDSERQKDAVDTLKIYTSEERDFYLSIFDEIERENSVLIDFLEHSLKPPATEDRLRPVLAGDLDSPFAPTSAPINKLLIAYLLRTGRIRYSKMSRDQSTAEIQSRSGEPISEARKRIFICRLGTSKNFPARVGVAQRKTISVFVQPDQTTVAEEVVDSTVEGQLIDVLSGVTGGEYVYFDAMPDPAIRMRYGEMSAEGSNAIREANEKVLKSFAKKHLDAEVRLSKESDPPYWALMTMKSNNEIRERLRAIGGLDGVFCGARLMVSPVADLPPDEEF
jgi:hypothetical protein